MHTRHTELVGLLFMALVVSTASGVAIGQHPTPADDDVIATVNGKPIAYGDLIRELIVRHGRSVLEDIMRQRALEQEVVRARVKVTEEEIANEIKRERKELARVEALRVRRNPKAGKPRTLEKMVELKYHMSFEGYHDIVKRWLLVRKMILRRENPAENEITLWFYRNRERYDEPSEVSVKHIYIAKVAPKTGRVRKPSEISQLLQFIRKGLTKGTDFSALAMRYSEDFGSRARGGDLGTINERTARGTLEPSFVEAMMSLRPGQSGGPIETPRGHHFILVTARQDGRRAEYQRMKARVRLDYLEDRAMLLREVFMRNLMDRTKTESYLEVPKASRKAFDIPGE